MLGKENKRILCSSEDTLNSTGYCAEVSADKGGNVSVPRGRKRALCWPWRWASNLLLFFGHWPCGSTLWEKTWHACTPTQAKAETTEEAVHRLHACGQTAKTHRMAFISLVYSGAALPSCTCFNQRALAGTCTVYTVRGVSLVVLPWPVCHWHKLHALLPSSEGRVCCPCCCVHRACSQTGATPIGCRWASWAFRKISTFLCGCFWWFGVHGLVWTVRNMHVGGRGELELDDSFQSKSFYGSVISVPPSILQLSALSWSCGRWMPFLSCSGCEHTVVCFLMVLFHGERHTGWVCSRNGLKWLI